MKFALLGLGRIAKKHIEVISKQMQGIAEITAICDIDQKET